MHGKVVPYPETVATAIRIGNPASWLLAEAARDESHGVIEAVSDLQILRAQRDLAARDGVFVEPASASGVAGLLARHEAGLVDAGQLITVTVTGHGLKDIDTALDFQGVARRGRGRRRRRPGCGGGRTRRCLSYGAARSPSVAPATSANLGPGYDAFGLALGLYDDVTCEVTAGGLEIEVTGEAADEVPRDESHLVVRSIRAAFDAMGVDSARACGWSAATAIPHGRGLGSSAAAVVSGSDDRVGAGSRRRLGQGGDAAARQRDRGPSGQRRGLHLRRLHDRLGER